jgi:hypothetical protein
VDEDPRFAADCQTEFPRMVGGKFQAPTSKLQRNFKHQATMSARDTIYHGEHLWMLRFGTSLELGAWNLELHQP